MLKKSLYNKNKYFTLLNYKVNMIINALNSKILENIKNNT